jgi:hypothetical protein
MAKNDSMAALSAQAPKRPIDPTKPASRSVRTYLAERNWLPSSAPAGDVTFDVTNEGPDDVHEFVVFLTDLAPDALPTNELELQGEIEDIAVGDTQSVTLDLVVAAAWGEARDAPDGGTGCTGPHLPALLDVSTFNLVGFLDQSASSAGIACELAQLGEITQADRQVLHVLAWIYLTQLAGDRNRFLHCLRGFLGTPDLVQQCCSFSQAACQRFPVEVRLNAERCTNVID